MLGRHLGCLHLQEPPCKLIDDALLGRFLAARLQGLGQQVHDIAQADALGQHLGQRRTHAIGHAIFQRQALRLAVSVGIAVGLNAHRREHCRRHHRLAHFGVPSRHRRKRSRSNRRALADDRRDGIAHNGLEPVFRHLAKRRFQPTRNRLFLLCAVFSGVLGKIGCAHHVANALQRGIEAACHAATGLCGPYVERVFPRGFCGLYRGVALGEVLVVLLLGKLARIVALQPAGLLTFLAVALQVRTLESVHLTAVLFGLQAIECTRRIQKFAISGQERVCALFGLQCSADIDRTHARSHATKRCSV